MQCSIANLKCKNVEAILKQLKKIGWPDAHLVQDDLPEEGLSVDEREQSGHDRHQAEQPDSQEAVGRFLRSGHRNKTKSWNI